MGQQGLFVRSGEMGARVGGDPTASLTHKKSAYFTGAFACMFCQQLVDVHGHNDVLEMVIALWPDQTRRGGSVGL